MNRRSFCTSVLAAASTAVMSPSRASSAVPRELSFYHTHTGERLDVCYHDGVGYVQDALFSIDYLLRDFRTGEVHPMDRGMLDLLSDLRTVTGRGGRFEIISAFRSKRTNEALRSRSGNVARSSLHLDGRAIDVRLAGFDTARLRDAAIALQRGGVGYYAQSDFVHVDTGRVRRW